MIQFQYFSNNIGSTKPIGYLTLKQFIQAHRNPKAETKAVFEQIAICETKGDMERKAESKQNNLYFFTPCVNLNGGRKYADIINFTGLLVLDFDHIDNAVAMKEHLFNEYEFVVCAWLSPSKKGVKALVKIPEPSDIKDFKRSFNAITEIMEIYDGFDVCNKNAVLPLFQSYDPDLLYRDDATTFEGKKEVEEYKYEAPLNPIIIDPSEKDKQSVLNIITHSINKIQDEGHPQLRGASIMLGGYVASGYVSFYEAEQWIYNLIESNGYLRKGITGYKKTASWGINEGTKRQLTL
jgi:hypothetical protein